MGQAGVPQFGCRRPCCRRLGQLGDASPHAGAELINLEFFQSRVARIQSVPALAGGAQLLDVALRLAAGATPEVLVALEDHRSTLFRDIKAGWEDARGPPGKGMVITAFACSERPPVGTLAAAAAEG